MLQFMALAKFASLIETVFMGLFLRKDFVAYPFAALFRMMRGG
jgi:hypothetical protein